VLSETSSARARPQPMANVAAHNGQQPKEVVSIDAAVSDLRGEAPHGGRHCPADAARSGSGRWGSHRHTWWMARADRWLRGKLGQRPSRREVGPVAAWRRRSARGGRWLTTEEMTAVLGGFVMPAVALRLMFKRGSASYDRRRGRFVQGCAGLSGWDAVTGGGSVAIGPWHGCQVGGWY
jgi:hypothetical protein